MLYRIDKDNYYPPLLFIVRDFDERDLLCDSAIEDLTPETGGIDPDWDD